MLILMTVTFTILALLCLSFCICFEIVSENTLSEKSFGKVKKIVDKVLNCF